MNTYDINNLYIESEIQTLYDITTVDMNYLESFCEATEDSDNLIKKIYSKLKEFFKKLITKIKSLCFNSANKTRTSIMTRDLTKKIKQAEKLVNKAKAKGLKTVKMYDIDEIVKTYNEYAKYADRAVQSWITKRNCGQTTPRQAEKFIDDYKKQTDKFQDKLNSLHSSDADKKEIPIDKALSNVKKYLSYIKDVKFYQDNVITKIERWTDYVEEVDINLINYSEKNGYIIHANTTKDIVHNNILYLKKNADWISSTVVAAASFITKGIIDITNYKEGYDKAKDFYSGGDVSGENIKNNQKIFANVYKKNKSSKNRTYQAADLIGKVATVSAATRKLGRKDNIYNIDMEELIK